MQGVNLKVVHSEILGRLIRFLKSHTRRPLPYICMCVYMKMVIQGRFLTKYCRNFTVRRPTDDPFYPY